MVKRAARAGLGLEPGSGSSQTLRNAKEVDLKFQNDHQIFGYIVVIQEKLRPKFKAEPGQKAFT